MAHALPGGMGKARGRRPLPAVRVLLLDDHALIREGLRAVISRMRGMRLMGVAEDIETGLALVARHRPHVVLVHRSPQRVDGMAFLAGLAERGETARVLMLAVHVRGEDVVDALRAGAAGYMLTAATPAELEAAIRGVARGETVLGHRIAHHVATAARGAAAPTAGVGRLTARQRDVLRLIAEGQGTKEIAEALGIGIRTVETHRANLRERLAIRDVAGLVRFAIAHGLIGAQDPLGRESA
jgi:DNA-binding NarL/FixJ family response regulator